jgi:hypothetical protein
VGRVPHTHDGDLTHEHSGGDEAHSHAELTADEATGHDHGPEGHGNHPYAPVGSRYGIRGGFAPGAILTGVAVAVGTILLFAALIGGIVAAAGSEDGVTSEEVTRLGWGAAIGLVIAQFLAYMWGGYTSGRMARGLGWLNGLMVPIVAVLLAVLIGVLIRAMGAETGVNVPYGGREVPVGVDIERFRAIGLVAAIGSLVAMFLGGIVGGMLGARWHDKLEARTDEVADREVRAA